MQEDQDSAWKCGGDSNINGDPKQKKNGLPWKWILVVLLVLLVWFLYHHHNKEKIVTTTEEAKMEAVDKANEAGWEELNAGTELYLRHNFPEAKTALESALEKGSVEAKAILGSMYVLGQGVAKDTHRGMEMLNKSAEDGSAFAKSILGQWYVHGGLGLEKNADKGLRLIQEAIDTGKYYGYVAKAKLYEEGAGYERDFDKAIEYIKEAAARGYKRADQDIEEINRKPKYETTAKLYATEYSIPEYLEHKYIGQKVRLTGTVKNVGARADNANITLVELDTGGNPYTIVCKFLESEKETASALTKGKTIAVQGIGDGHTNKTIHLKDCWFPDV